MAGGYSFDFPWVSTRSSLRSWDNVGSRLYSLISIEFGGDKVCSLMSIRDIIFISFVVPNTSIRFRGATEKWGIYTAIVRNWCNTKDIVRIIQVHSNRCRDGFLDSTNAVAYEIIILMVLMDKIFVSSTLSGFIKPNLM
jgi:hypothetical protein